MLVDRYGLRKYATKGKRRAGFFAPIWKLDGETELRRGLSIEFDGNWLSLAWNKRELTPSRAVLIEVSWPPSEPVEEFQSLTVGFRRFRGPSNDLELLGLAEDLRDPHKTYATSMGPFVRVLELGWAEGQIEWQGRPVKATMDDELPIDIPQQIELLERVITDQERIEKEVRQAIIDGLYELWVDNWRQNDLIVPPEEFAARMPLDSVRVHPGGEIEIWFEDDDFFAGHGVLVYGTIAGGFEPAEMHG